jgi:PKHD-type hydroxylase
MTTVLPSLLNPQELSDIRQALGQPHTPWHQGQITAGSQAQGQKRNEQLDAGSPLCQKLRQLVLKALERHPLFFSAALPRKVFNPLFNRYTPEHPSYGPHVDGGVLHSRDSSEWVRTDLSCTLFLSEPSSYGGGELRVYEGGQFSRFKLPAGDAVLYPGHCVHEVTPVTQGERLACFFWVESMVRAHEQRQLLMTLDGHLMALRDTHGETPPLVGLTGVYHQLLRQWAQT